MTKITRTYTLRVTGTSVTLGELQDFIWEVDDSTAKITFSVDHGDQREPAQTTITAIVEPSKS
jgi:hypothetical protein